MRIRDNICKFANWCLIYQQDMRKRAKNLAQIAMQTHCNVAKFSTLRETPRIAWILWRGPCRGPMGRAVFLGPMAAAVERRTIVSL